MNTGKVVTVTERAVVKQVLKLYKKLTCLWDTTDSNYYNQQSRKEAHEKIMKVWRQIAPDITTSVVKKKIENMRAAYRRERKVVEYFSVTVAHDPDNKYKPRLWYYNLLSFLNDVTHNETSSEDEEEEVHIPPMKTRRISKETPDLIKNDVTEESEDIEKREAKREDPTYESTYGLTVAKQLKELDDDVRYEAERFISEVIYRARTGTLPKYTPETVDTLFIPQSGPSWYDGPYLGSDHQQPVSCMMEKVPDLSDPEIKNEYENVEES